MKKTQQNGLSGKECIINSINNHIVNNFTTSALHVCVSDKKTHKKCIINIIKNCFVNNSPSVSCVSVLIIKTHAKKKLLLILSIIIFKITWPRVLRVCDNFKKNAKETDRDRDAGACPDRHRQTETQTQTDRDRCRRMLRQVVMENLFFFGGEHFSGFCV
jgi:hypothetical protein